MQRPKDAEVITFRRKNSDVPVDEAAGRRASSGAPRSVASLMGELDLLDCACHELVVEQLRLAESNFRGRRDLSAALQYPANRPAAGPDSKAPDTGRTNYYTHPDGIPDLGIHWIKYTDPTDIGRVTEIESQLDKLRSRAAVVREKLLHASPSNSEESIAKLRFLIGALITKAGLPDADVLSGAINSCLDTISSPAI